MPKVAGHCSGHKLFFREGSFRELMSKYESLIIIIDCLSNVHRFYWLRQKR